MSTSKRKLDKNNLFVSNNKRNRLKINEIDLHATSNLETVYLNDEKTSWIQLKKFDSLLTIDEFEELWKFKPANKLQIKLYGKIHECPRYSISYLKSYKFSGLDHQADMNIPVQVEKLLEFSKKEYNSALNQSLVNWYDADGSISRHADDTRQLITDSDVFSYSFGPAKRVFIIEPKNYLDENHLNNIKYNIHLTHNTLVIMSGKCQKTHYHSVPKNKKLIESDANERRINVTFRCFKENN